MVIGTTESELAPRSRSGPNSDTAAPDDGNAPDIAVSVRGLHKAFGAVEVVSDIDLDIPVGSFVSILGPSGSGKTTVLRCVAGLERPTRGRIDLAGRSVFDADRSIDESIAVRNVGMIFQNYALWPHKTVLQHVLYPLGRGVGKLPRAQRSVRARDTLESVGLAELADRFPYELSGGQQQRVAVARAIAAHPPLLLMDEPLSNLDTQLRQRLRRELRTVHERAGATSLYVTHDQEEAFALSDHVVLMHNGRILQQGPPLEIHRRPRTRFAATFLGFENIVDTANLDRIVVRPLAADVGAASVGFRARAVRLITDRAETPSTSADAVRLGPWTVRSVEFTGDEVFVRVERGGVTVLAAVPVTTSRVLDDLIDIHPGHTVDIDIDGADLIALEPDPSGA